MNTTVQYDQIKLDSTDEYSSKKYPNNTPAHFTNHLQAPVAFGPNWEVGLVSASVPFTWRTIKRPIRFGVFVAPTPLEGVYSGTREIWKINSNDWFDTMANQVITGDYFPLNSSAYFSYVFPAGFYPKRVDIGRKLTNDINEMLKSSKIGMSLQFDELPDGSYRMLAQGGKLGIFSDSKRILTDILGFDTEGFGNEIKLLVDTATQKKIKLDSLWGIESIDNIISKDKNLKSYEAYSTVDIYCSAAAPYIYGSTLCSHIGTVSSAGCTYGDQLVFTPNPRQYYIVNATEFKEIEVKLTHPPGDLVDFPPEQVSRIVLHLDFRPRLLRI